MSERVKFDSVETMKEMVGKEVGISEYIVVDQEMITKFAETTKDFQWIHIDVERCAKESPFKKTIAHGYLTLSLLPYLMSGVVDIEQAKMVVNYGVDNLRFLNPVIVDSELRMKIAMAKVRDLRRMVQITLGVTFEVKGNDKPVCTADIIFLLQI